VHQRTVTVVKIPATIRPRYMADNLRAGISRLPDATLRENRPGVPLICMDGPAK
jgi:hypothetical protein